MKTEMLSGRSRKPTREPPAGVQSRNEVLVYVVDGAAMPCVLLTKRHELGTGSNTYRPAEAIKNKNNE